jgi:hypothetical protein
MTAVITDSTAGFGSALAMGLAFRVDVGVVLSIL